VVVSGVFILIGIFRTLGSSAGQVAGAIAARPRQLRTAVELVLVAALFVQGGRLVWTLFEPRPVVPDAVATVPAAPVDPAVFQRFDAFFRTGGRSSLAEDTAAGSSQMRLFGVRAGGPGGGSAIIGFADGHQVSVGLGEEVEPGLVLHSVGPDFVTLARGASVTRLDFAEAPMGAAPPPPPPPGPQVVTPTPTAAAVVAPTGPVVDPAPLMGALRPRLQGLGMNGFTIAEGADRSALAAAGLQPGDVILSVNDTDLTGPAQLATLRRQLSSATSARIRFERDGAVQTTTIRTGP
jgi:general secretion pathway protein C